MFLCSNHYFSLFLSPLLNSLLFLFSFFPLILPVFSSCFLILPLSSSLGLPLSLFLSIVLYQQFPCFSLALSLKCLHLFPSLLCLPLSSIGFLSLDLSYILLLYTLPSFFFSFFSISSSPSLSLSLSHSILHSLFLFLLLSSSPFHSLPRYSSPFFLFPPLCTLSASL